MPRCCLVEIEPKRIALLTAALHAAAAAPLITVARFDVGILSQLDVELIIVDVDRLVIDSLEAIRQLRFVLPDSIIVVYTDLTKSTWARDCHKAGANGVLSCKSNESQLIFGLSHAIIGGCFTDSHFKTSA